MQMSPIACLLALFLSVSRSFDAMSHSWQTPDPGDFLWCHFPHLPNLEPGPKPRPVLVFAVDVHRTGVKIQVVPGTTQGLDRLYPGEAPILDTASAAFRLAGLSFDTKFQFGSMTVLPWDDRYFKAPPHRPFGDHPKLGLLHPTLVASFSAAFAVHKSRQSWL